MNCSICGVACPPEADAVEAGGDVGRAHTACFEAWDREAEAWEMFCPAVLEADRSHQLLAVPA